MSIDVIRLAKEANINLEHGVSIRREPVWIATQDELERFTALVMEECAKVIERNTPQLVHSEITAELRRLAAIEDAAKKLVSAKGRYHTECNYKALEALMKETP